MSSALSNDNGANDSVSGDESENRVTGAAENQKWYLASGLPDAVVKRLVGDGGREVFLLWVHQQLQNDESDKAISESLQCFADKEGVRIALHLIKQDREVAEPARSTMQKINRFLMSSSIYR